MHRLFSTFPAGRPGVGLLFLRVAVGAMAAVLGGLYLADVTAASVGPWIGGLLAISSGLSLIIGLFTPCGAAIAAVGGFALAVRGFGAVPSSLSPAPLCAALVGVVAAAIVLLGPGAYSLDSRLFGRREIFIRAASHRPTP